LRPRPKGSEARGYEAEAKILTLEASLASRLLRSLQIRDINSDMLTANTLTNFNNLLPHKAPALRGGAVRPSVCLFVCLSPTTRTAAGGGAYRVGRTDLQLTAVM